MCECQPPTPEVADANADAGAVPFAPSRRRLILGGLVCATTLGIGPAALAAAPPPLSPGAKPDVFLARLGLKPPAPARPEAAPRTATGAPPRRAPTGGPAHRTLALDNINTGERLTATYMEDGRYLPDALAAINHLMRDRRSGAVATIDPALLDLICDVRTRLDTNQPVQIISGYRAPRTNARMRRTDGAVARKSYHTRGMAADIAVPGCSIGNLRRVAVAMGRGGVGAYPASGFVHVDVGPPRTW